MERDSSGFGPRSVDGRSQSSLGHTAAPGLGDGFIEELVKALIWELVLSTSFYTHMGVTLHHPF